MIRAMINRVRFTLWLSVAFSGIAFSQAPVADFSANITTGCGTVTATFTDLSTNNPTQWNWDFGNGNNSLLESPVNLYTNPGMYTVTLTTTNGSGSDTEIKTAYITVFENPVASISADTTYGCRPLMVQFSDQSTPGSGVINNWVWDFGDGNLSTSQHPSHEFILNGTFSVGLTVTDDNGCQNGILVANYINLSTPANAVISGGPIDTCVFPVTISFNDLSTSGSAPIESWAWDFGDGSGINPVQNPSHVFTSAGTYDVTLIVSDSLGCPDTVVLVDYINVVDFQADFVIDTLSNCPNFVLIFNDATTPDPVSWDWDFGDGNGAATQNPLYFYDSAGVYTVKLVTENAFGCVDSISQSVTYSKPSSSFVVDTAKACSAPLAVTFTSSASGSAPLTYDWNFDDGSPNSNLPNPTHSYLSEGVFNPYLVVIDGLGCTDTFFLADVPDTIIILPPIGAFTLTPEDGGCQPLTVTFTDSSYGTVGTINSWSWNFDDPLSGGSNTSSLPNPVHTFDSSGVYSVQLVVGNDLGCTGTVVEDVLVGIAPIVVDFAMSDSVVCYNVAVNFTDLSGDSINNWLWMFGDTNNVSTDQNPSYPMQDTGVVVITLIAGYNGCNDTMQRTINVLPPVPVINVSPAFGCTVPHTATFLDSSIGADTWLWDFGDGFTSTSANTTHTYTVPGDYSVVMVISNVNGCVDSITATVKIPDLQADFTTPDTLGCFSLTSDFTNTSTYAFTPSIMNSHWEYGDGTFDNTGGAFAFTHTFTDTGKFEILLVITDFYGCRDTMIKTSYVKVNGVYPGFSYNPATGCAPQPVVFSDTSSGSLAMTSWNWDFGDNSSMDTTQNPVHVYDSAGVFSVELVVADANGCADSITYSNIIAITRPNPSFSNKSFLCISEDLGIVDSSWGDGLSYVWDFGDGNSDTVVNPLHGYADTGIYVLTLTVTDSNGCDSTLVKSIDVSPTSTAGIVVDTLNTSCPPLVVTFQDSSSADVVSWFWDFGDGATSANENPIHTYSYPDTFDVMLAVANSTGCMDTLILPNIIQIGGPFGSFVFNPDSGCVPLDVLFSATAYHTTQYLWGFGDGVIDSLTGASVVHTYLSPGTPHPALILSDSLGCQLAAQPPDPDSLILDDPVALFGSNTTLLYSTFCGLDTVYFYDSSFVQSPYTSIVSWAWDFGDGNTDTLPNPNNVYADTGTYLVTLEIITDLGCSKYDSLLVTIMADTINTLTASIPVFTDVGCGGDNTGEATGVAQGGTAPYTYLWSDDSLQTTIQSTGLVAGNYTFMLIDSNGCLDSATVLISEPPQLFVNIIGSTMVTCNGLANGTAVAQGSGGSGGYSFLWDDVAATTSDSVLSLAADTFTVVITDSIGCMAQDSLIVTEPGVLVVSNGMQVDVLCFGDSTGLASAAVSGGTPPYNYSWNTVAIETDTVVDSLYAGDYTITVTDSFTCTNDYTFTIIQAAALAAGVVNTIDVECYNDSLGSATVAISGGTSPYLVGWISVGDIGLVVDSLWAGWHIYTVADAVGCVFMDSVEILQPTEIDITINAGDGAICVFGIDSIMASATGGTAPLTYLWDHNLGGGTTWKVITPDTITTYTVQVTDANSCVVKDSIEILVYELLKVGVSSDTVCVGDSIGIEMYLLEGMDTSYNYIWDFGDGAVDTTGDTSIAHVYVDVGNSLISLAVMGPDVCVTDSLKFDSLTILASPFVDFVATPLVTSTTSPLITFIDTSGKSGVPGENVVGWFWDFGDGTNSDLEDDTHFYLDSGTYSVTHSVINEIGCTDTIRIDIRINPSFEIEIPSAFTPDPNGASGGVYDPSALDNNIFYPVTQFVEEFTMLIFNRWGELVFESSDLAIGWDGYYRGEMSQQDVYVWKIKLRYVNGTEFNQIGDVTLVR